MGNAPIGHVDAGRRAAALVWPSDNQPRFTEAEAELRRLLDEADEVLRVKYSNDDYWTELSGGSRPAAYRLALSPPEMT